MNVEKRIRIEKKIASRLVADAIAAGYSLSVNNGEEVVIRQSRDKAAILAEMFSVDMEHLIYHKDGVRQGWVYLVYGNGGWDVICDYTTNLDPVLVGANALADKLSAVC
jgi:hypothetical protein